MYSAPMNAARAKDELASAGQAAASSGRIEGLARVGLVARGVVYALIGVLALQIAFGTSDHNAGRTGVTVLLGNAKHQSGNQQSKTMTAEFMSHSGGRLLVLAAGLAIITLGARLVVRGPRRKFLEHLDLSGLDAREQKTVEILGLVGSCSRGLVFGVVGAFGVYSCCEARWREVSPGNARGGRRLLTPTASSS
jgi:hypothetical protein